MFSLTGKAGSKVNDLYHKLLSKAAFTYYTDKLVKVYGPDLPGSYHQTKDKETLCWIHL